MMDIKDTTTRAQPHGIWDFALSLYQQRHIAEQCLLLQDSYGIQVNLLLWCYWLEARARALNVAQLELAQVHTVAFNQNYIQPLRQLRRQLKVQYPEPGATLKELGQTIKQAELLAEQQELTSLEELAQDWPKSHITSGNNSRCYLSHAQVPSWQIDTTLALFQQALASLATKAIY